jgi:hypothetical protein
MPLVVFLGAMPTLRTAHGVILIGGAGMLVGVIGYCHRCAAATSSTIQAHGACFVRGAY